VGRHVQFTIANNYHFQDISRMRDLTPAELGIWLGHQTATDPTLFNCAELIEFHGALDAEIFERALRCVLERTEILSTRFFELGGVPKADVVANPDGTFKGNARITSVQKSAIFPAISDASIETASSHSRAPASLGEATLDELVNEPFALADGKLCRHALVFDGPHLVGWLFVAHHIALDGFAFQLLIRRVAAVYTSLHHGGAHPPATVLQMETICNFDLAYQESHRRKEAAAYFRRAPEGHFPKARLARYVRVEQESPITAAVRPIRSRTLAPTSLFVSVQEAARQLQASWPELVLAIAARFTSHASGQRRFALGVPVMLRLGTPKLRVPCMAMNIVRLPLNLSFDESLAQTLDNLRARWREQSLHHQYRYEELDELSFGPVVNVLPFTDEPTFGDVTCQSFNISAGPVADLSIMLAPRSNGLELILDGNPTLFSEHSLAEMSQDLLNYFESSLSVDVHVLAPCLEHREPDIVELLNAAANEHPTAIAVVDGTTRWTYAQLRSSVQRFSAGLRRVLGGETRCFAHTLIAIDVRRGVDAVALMLATLELGAGFAFLDPDQPLARRADLCRRLEPLLVVSSHPETWESLDAGRAVSPSQLEGVAPSRGQANQADPGDPAYVVFTSGSTGAPKGVVISRRAVSAFVRGAMQTYPLTSEDRVLQFAPMTFDACIEEILVTLCLGATLVIRTDEMLDSMPTFTQTCDVWRITVLDLPTAFWHEWVRSFREVGSSVPSSLRTVIIGGEAADASAIETFREHAPHVQLLNTYGPSECTVVATCAELSHVDVKDGVPIGRALPTVTAFVIDEAGRTLEGPCEGELCLTGPQLATGYLTAQETKARFVSLATPPLRAYRTGDRVRRSATGELYFLGRIDHEIKLSGYRINPAEVEATLNRHPNVATSAVTADKSNGHVLLTAHVQPREPAHPSSPAAEQLRQFLLELLPAPMVPTRYVFHTALPLSTHGKLDRRALVQHESPPGQGQTLDDPLFLTSPGRELLDVWRKVLGRTDARPDDDFFQLGGHSLQVIQLAARLHGVLPNVSVSAIFRNPTPRGLLTSVHLSTPRAADVDFRDVAALRLPPIRRRAVTTPASILLTGATGFVGSHLLCELLSRGITVQCLVRGETPGAARARLSSALQRHRCMPPDERLTLVHAIPWDITSPPSSELTAMVAPPDVIIHCAADVNLTRPFDSLAPANVLSTRWLLEYAALHAARFCYVSTLAVAPTNVSASHVPEQIFDAHPGLVDGYQQSKWHAERLCKLAADQGLDVQVVRLGRVVGSTATTLVNPGDIVWRIARASTRCGYWPQLNVAEVWTPVDTVASIAAQLSLTPAAPGEAACRVFHVTHQSTVHLERLRLALVRAGFLAQSCALPDWLEQVRLHADAEDAATLAFFELGEGNRALPSDLPYACTNLLSALPHLDTMPLTDELIDAYVQTAVKDGLLRRTRPIP
jgi:nonribosomal peptide synthetase MxcG